MKTGWGWIEVLAVSLSVACSGDFGGAPDASTPDASIPGPVAVTFAMDTQLPPDGHTVIFLRADDTVIDVVETDQDGRASAMFDQPGTVVVLVDQTSPGDPPVLFHTLHTYLGVPPSTDILVGNGITGESGSVTVTGPAMDDALAYTAETLCGVNDVPSGTTTVTAPLSGCGSRTPVVWAAYLQGESGGDLRGFSAFAPEVDVVPDATLTVDGPLREDVLQTTRVTGLPEGQVQNAQYRIRSGRGTLQEGLFQAGLPVVDGAFELEDRLHDLGGLGLTGTVGIVFYSPASGTTEYTAWTEHVAAPVVDVSAVVPPVPGDAIFHRADETWTWTLESPGTVDGLRGRFSFSRSEEESVVWQVLAPNDGSAVRIPRLPAPFDEYHLPSGSTEGSASLRYLGHTRGYRALVEDVEGALFHGGQPGDVVASTGGRTTTE